MGRAGPSEAGRDDLIAAAWQVTEKTNALRNTIGPLKRGWEPLSPTGARITIAVAEDLAYTARELAFASAAAGFTSSGCGAVPAKADLLRRELDCYRAEIKAAGRRFHCSKPKPPAMTRPAFEETGTPFGDRAALLDLLSRELSRLRAICHGPAGQSRSCH